MICRGGRLAGSKSRIYLGLKGYFDDIADWPLQRGEEGECVCVCSGGKGTQMLHLSKSKCTLTLIK